MPVQIEIDTKKQITFFRIYGFHLADEALDALKAFYQSEPTKFLVIDAREMTGSNLDEKSFNTINDYARSQAYKRPAGAKTAIVSPLDFGYGLARMDEILLGFSNFPHPFSVFRSIEKALEWLKEI